MADLGLALEGGDALFGQWSENWGRQCTETLLQSGRRFDAVLAGSDQIARGVLDQLRESGLSVPSDVAVMGFDNWDILSATARPPLTSIDMNLQELGRAAALSLSEAISGQADPGIHRLPVRLVPRESTASIL
jgi:LacI family transcriptional regulator